MNDHDLIIKLGTQMEYLIKEVQGLKDGVKKDVVDLQSKTDNLEKIDIELKNEIKVVQKQSDEASRANSLRITALEAVNNLGVTKSETTRSYIWRKFFEWLMPFLFLLGGLVLAKLGILNLN